jgi:hypothetical protein
MADTTEFALMQVKRLRRIAAQRFSPTAVHKGICGVDCCLLIMTGGAALLRSTAAIRGLRGNFGRQGRQSVSMHVLRRPVEIAGQSRLSTMVFTGQLNSDGASIVLRLASPIPANV